MALMIILNQINHIWFTWAELFDISDSWVKVYVVCLSLCYFFCSLDGMKNSNYLLSTEIDTFIKVGKFYYLNNK